MLCQRCLCSAQRLSLRQSSHAIARRNNGRSNSTITKPFETPPSMAPSMRSKAAATAAVATATTTTGGGEGDHGSTSPSTAESVMVKSSVPAGTVLKGLNYLKDQTDPLAMADHEYPDWLWTILSEIRGEVKVEDKKTVSKKKAKARMMRAAETEIKQVPIHHQSIDLPVSDGTQASTTQSLTALKQVTRAMRADHRAKIREANFLRTMK